ncbi:hypothetical protein KBD34_02235 [Patescibacteria group bacterium]|nr:hypothetical protein [Patescibacteria group bacterium]
MTIAWFTKRPVSGFKLAPPAPAPVGERWALRILLVLPFFLGPGVVPWVVNHFANMFGFVGPLETSEFSQAMFYGWLVCMIGLLVFPYIAAHCSPSTTDPEKGVWWFEHVTLHWLYLPIVGWVVWCLLWPFVANLFDRFVLGPSETLRWIAGHVISTFWRVMRFFYLIGTRYISPWLDYAGHYLTVAWRRIWGS